MLLMRWYDVSLRDYAFMFPVFRSGRPIYFTSDLLRWKRMTLGPGTPVWINRLEKARADWNVVLLLQFELLSHYRQRIHFWWNYFRC
jgi:hypothetical protein